MAKWQLKIICCTLEWGWESRTSPGCRKGSARGALPEEPPRSPVLHFGFSDSSAWKEVTDTSNDALEATAVHLSLEEQSKAA